MLHDLFMNWIPAALLVVFALWFFGILKWPKSQAAPKSAIAGQTSAPVPPPAKQPAVPAPEQLVRFASDFSGGHPEFLALARGMIEAKAVPPLETLNGAWDIWEDEGAGPERFAVTVVQALTSATIERLGPPMVYFDWKQDVDDAAAQYDRLFETLTGRPGPIVATLATTPDDVHYAPATQSTGPTGVGVATSYAFVAFDDAGYTLLEVVPGSGWDAHLIAALPHAVAEYWNDVALLPAAGAASDTKVRILDARHTIAPFLGDYRPDDLPLARLTKKAGTTRPLYFWQQPG